MVTNLRAIREETGLTMNEVARRSGISSGRLSIIERGVEPKPEERAAILSVLLPVLTEQAAKDGRTLEGEASA